MSKRYAVQFLILVVFTFAFAFSSYGDDKAAAPSAAPAAKAATETKAADTKTADLKEGFVGAETCKGCHPDSYEQYKKSPHSKAHVKGPESQDACETCHGAGAKHVEKGGGRGVEIFNFDKNIDPALKSAKCLACHQANKAQVFWSMSKHSAASAGLSCDSCHKLMLSENEKFLKDKQPDLCFKCHKDIKMQSNKQSHHPIKEGKVLCNDCHDPHGEFNSKMLKADTVNELCYKCHAEKRGPFMYEHPPVVENCLTCHAPHGSNHTRLLTARVPILCKDCHQGTGHGNTPYSNYATFSRTTTGFYSTMIKTDLKACVNCHVQIHGSNGPGIYGQRFIR
ncbi:DmsE family decaheme c-type cytochrome [Candidatus Magnetominusculus dajiuhuensis]|uniref:DmsE family decaheme c-type cytochrome n=1 Tax=Candidatus Magnetominusculus dajiuhuensis TaxID=3137712 RepID=UPI003B42CB8A